jgi:hypothetical protein
MEKEKSSRFEFSAFASKEERRFFSGKFVARFVVHLS